MAKKSPVIQQLQFSLRADQTLDVCYGVAPNTQVTKNVDWEMAMMLLRRIEPSPLIRISPPTAAPQHGRARWRWAQPLVNFLCGGVK
jgi:hypothetical protein